MQEIEPRLLRAEEILQQLPLGYFITGSAYMYWKYLAANTVYQTWYPVKKEWTVLVGDGAENPKLDSPLAYNTALSFFTNKYEAGLGIEE